ncbi:MAG: hypothetical protein Q7S61_03990 [bacterium]|nr:hypothetical protein [bacterium]
MTNNRWKIGFALGIIFLVLVILITFPSILHLQDKMIGDPGDGYQFMGFQYLGHMQIASGQFPFGWTHYWRYPFGAHFQDLSDSAIFIVEGVILYQFFQNPVFVYNISVLLLLFFNVCLSYISFRVFFSRLHSFIGAVVYGLSFYTIAKTGGHINLILNASLLLCIASIVKIYKEKGSRNSFILLTLSFILIPLSSLQHPFFLLGTLPFLFPFLPLLYKKELVKSIELAKEKKVSLLISICIPILFIFLFHGHKIIGFFENKIYLPESDIQHVPPINFLIPNSYITSLVSLVKNNTYRWIEHVTFVGYLEMILFVCACLFLKPSREKKLLIILTIIFFLFAIGAPPYSFLTHFFPYKAVLESGRFFIIFYIWFTMLILLFLQQLQNKKIILVILSLLILERVPLSFQLSPSLYDKEFITAVQKTNSSAVLDLPLYTESYYGPRYDMYSIYYKKPIVNGYFHWSADRGEAKQLTDRLVEYKCYRNATDVPQDYTYDKAVSKKKDVIRVLKKYDIRTVVIHKDLNLNKDTCQRAKKYIDVLLEDSSQWKKVFESKEKIVFELQ